MRTLLLTLLYAASTWAQLPAGFSPPAELLSGPLAEGTLTSNYERAMTLARYDNERTVTGALTRTEHLVHTQAARILRRDVRDVLARRRTIGYRSIIRDQVARAQFFLDELAKDVDLDDREAAPVVVGVVRAFFATAHLFRDQDSRVFTGRTFDREGYPHGQLVMQLGPRLIAAVATAPSAAARYRLTRRTLEILVWDVARHGSSAAALAASVDLLSATAREPSANAQDNEAELRRLGAAPLFAVVGAPVVPGSSLISQDDPYAEIKGAVWAMFRNEFHAVQSCGRVMCAATNGQGTYYYTWGFDTGMIREDTVRACMGMGWNQATGTPCAQSMVCNELSGEGVTCQPNIPMFYARIDTRHGPRRREIRMPWWPDPY
mgnify:CR=1 FL=1